MITPVASVFCSLVASFGEITSKTADSASCPLCSLSPGFPCLVQETCLAETCRVEWRWRWINFFCTLLEHFQTFCPDGVHFAQTVVPFAHFQNQAKKRGVFGWGWGYFLFVHIPERGLWRLVFWAKWDPILAKWDPYGQIVLNVGKSALELGKKNSIILTRR